MKVAFVKFRPDPTWSSLEEISLAQEAAWRHVGRINKVIQVSFFEWTQDAWIETLQDILMHDVIVLPCPFIRFVALLRKRMGFKGRFIIYTHGQASQGFRNAGDSIQQLLTRDLFLCASRAEADAVRICFPNARFRIVEHALLNRSFTRKTFKSNSCARLVYVGRISEQKNLHTLLLAFAIFRQKKMPVKYLEIYGKEDRFGSPNMGRSSGRYLKYLQGLCKKLKIDEFVRWKGFVPRDKIFSKLGKEKYIFVSASLHSAEDFGASVLTSLRLGSSAVLTSWGGHRDFCKRFPSRQISLVRVHGSPAGPWVSPSELANKIVACLKAAETNGFHFNNAEESYQKHYSLSRVSQKLARVAMSNIRADVRVVHGKIRQDLVRRVLPRKSGWRFLNYEDPLAHSFFCAYGMQEPQPPRIASKKKVLVMSPWVREQPSGLFVNDPHRGCFRVPKVSKCQQLLWLEERGFTYRIERSE